MPKTLMSYFKNKVVKLLADADVIVNGTRPWDIQVHNELFYTHSIVNGSLGFGESYMDGWWDASSIDELVCKLMRNESSKHVSNTIAEWAYTFRSQIVNLQSRAGSLKVIKTHYDLDNDLYMAFLDPYNQYTCGYFKDTDDLAKAQEQKMDLICKKLHIKPTDRVLDIGCGWGGFAKWAVEHYGCHVTGISISDEQISYAKNFTKDFPVEILKTDYRDLSGTFDKILICGMIEHVGSKNYKTIMRIVHERLEDDGLFLLHTIGCKNPVGATNPWIHKYIFPNGMLPTITQLSAASEKIFLIEDLQNFGAYYDKTLIKWFENFDQSWPRFKDKYSDKFYRKWKYYFLSCAGSFRARNVELWQFIFSKKGVLGGYHRVS